MAAGQHARRRGARRRRGRAPQGRAVRRGRGRRAQPLTGWLAAFVTAVAFAMSAFHLYTAYAIVPTQTLRPCTSRSCCSCASSCSRWRAAFATASCGGTGSRRALAIAIVVYALQGGDDFTDRNTSPTPWDIAFGIALIALVLEAMRRTHRLDHAGRSPSRSSLYALLGPLAAGAVDAQGLRHRPAGRRDVHDAGGHLRRRGRRVVVADHPVHDLRRVPAALGRGQVLHRLLVRGDGRQAHRRRAHRRARVVPARRAVGLGRRDDGDARRRRLPDAREGRLREERRRRAARGRRAWARSSRRRCSARPRS